MKIRLLMTSYELNVYKSPTMETIFETIDTFEEQRRIFVEENDKALKILNDKLMSTLASDKALSFDELCQFGQTLRSDLHRQPNELDYGHQPSYRVRYAFTPVVDNKPEEPEEDQQNIFNYECDGVHKEEEKIDDIFTREQNYQRTFMKCVKTIQNLGIDIFSTTSLPQKYKERGWSSCIGGTDCFKFDCQKNNYRFQVRFIDDCDCYPGILEIKEVENLQTKEITKIECDLFGQNCRNEVELVDFLKFLEYDDKKTHFVTEFERFICLPELLAEHGIMIKKFKHEMCDENMSLNCAHNFNFMITIATTKGECIIIPFGFKKEYQIFLHPTIEYMNNLPRPSYQPPMTEIDVNSFRNEKHIRRVNYKSIDDLDELIKSIHKYIDFLRGDNGFYDEVTGTFKNGRELIEYINKLDHTHLGGINIEEKKSKTNKFDITFDVHPLQIMWSFEPANERILIDKPYPRDTYRVRFWYKANDKLCKLVFECVKYDMLDACKLKPREYMDTELVFTKEFEDTYDNCERMIKQFVDKFKAHFS